MIFLNILNSTLKYQTTLSCLEIPLQVSYVPMIPRPRNKLLFVSCNGPKKYRVGRSVKKKFLIFIFLVKNVRFMHVLR